MIGSKLACAARSALASILCRDQARGRYSLVAEKLMRSNLTSILLNLILGAAPAVAATPCVGTLPAANGQTCRETLAVNAASFLQAGSGVVGSQSDIERIVRSAARGWSQYGSSRRGYEYVGTTTATDCNSPYDHIIIATVGLTLLDGDVRRPVKSMAVRGRRECSLREWSVTHQD